MRRAAWGLLLVGGICAGWAAQAQAGVKVKVKTQDYAIAGKTGEVLLDAMDRRGPKHGLLTRAIAQTRYSVAWKMEWGETRTACRVKRADGELSITYTYPRVDGPLSADLAVKWRRFLVGVRKHEETHGMIARQMVVEAERSISRLKIRSDPGCRKSRKEVKRLIDAAYAKFEGRQAAFDQREHREGGPVEGLIAELVRKR